MTKQGVMIALKRIYEKPEMSDGTRVLVERLWPRGLSKEQAHVDIWFKEIAPSNELRVWFGHDPEKWVEFRQRYEAELASDRETRTNNGELALLGLPIQQLDGIFAGIASHLDERVQQHRLVDS